GGAAGPARGDRSLRWTVGAPGGGGPRGRRPAGGAGNRMARRDGGGGATGQCGADAHPPRPPPPRVRGHRAAHSSQGPLRQRQGGRVARGERGDAGRARPRLRRPSAGATAPTSTLKRLARSPAHPARKVSNTSSGTREGAGAGGAS